MGVVILNGRIAQALLAAANAQVFAVFVDRLVSGSVLVQHFDERQRHLEGSVGGFVLRRRLRDSGAFDFLRYRPANVEDVILYIRPFERIDLALPCAGIVCNREEHIKAPVVQITFLIRLFPGDGHIPLKLLRGVVPDFVLLGSEVLFLEITDKRERVAGQIFHPYPVIEHGAQ